MKKDRETEFFDRQATTVAKQAFEEHISSRFGELDRYVRGYGPTVGLFDNGHFALRPELFAYFKDLMEAAGLSHALLGDGDWPGANDEDEAYTAVTLVDGEYEEVAHECFRIAIDHAFVWAQENKVQ